MGARQTWIPLSSRGLKTEVFVPTQFPPLNPLMLKAEGSIWGSTVTSSGHELKHTSYKMLRM